MITKQTDAIAALIVAAGSGKRMGGDVPKQFLEIGGEPILRLTLERFQQASLVSHIYVVTSRHSIDRYGAIFKDEWGITKVAKIVAGGAERHHSVWAGLQALEDSVEIVLIHDGVRPFVSPQIIEKSVQAAKNFGAAVVGVSPKDTVKHVNHERINGTIDRHSVLLAQTPQTFQKKLIISAYEHAFLKNEFSTDDAALVENLGREVVVVPGDSRNIKITTPEDLLIARAFMDGNT